MQVPAPQRIHGIYTVPELSGRILGVTESGTILLLDSHSLEEKTSLALSEQPVVLYRTFIFASSTCAFGSKATKATAIVLSFDKADALNIHIVSVDSNDEVLVTSQFKLSQNREVCILALQAILTDIFLGACRRFLQRSRKL